MHYGQHLAFMLCSAGFSFRLVHVSRRRCPRRSGCDRVAPSASALASRWRVKGCDMSGCARRVESARACFIFAKDNSCSSCNSLRGLFEQVGQRSSSVREILDKTLVEACQAQKTPDIFYRARGGPVRDGRNLVGVRFDHFTIHELATKLDEHFVSFAKRFSARR